MRRYKLRFISVLIIVLLFSCKKLVVPTPNAGEASLTNTVSFGGGFLTGFQDAAFYTKGQAHSIASLLANSFMSAGGSQFTEPLVNSETGIGINSKPWESDYNSKSVLGYKTNCLNETGISPVKTLFNADATTGMLAHTTSDNFAIVGATLRDLCSSDLGLDPVDGGNPFYNRICSQVGVFSPLQDAIAKKASFGVFWLGMEEIYNYAARGGDHVSILETAAFEALLDSVLTAFINSGTSDGVIANIPPIDVFPFYALIPWDGLVLDSIKADSLNLVSGNYFGFEEGANGFLCEASYGFLPMKKMQEGEYMLLNTPLDSIRCNYMGSKGDLVPNRYVLDSMEVDLILKRITNFNVAIEKLAKKHELAFVDMHAYFSELKENGARWNAADFSTDYISGGYFSLDGFYPNQKAYGMIANEFIQSINLHYNATLPWVDCSACDGVLFP